MKKRSESEKRKIVGEINRLRLKSGCTLQSACKKSGISTVSYYNWKKQGATTFVQAQKTSHEAFAIPKILSQSKIKRDDQKRILEIKASFPHMGVKQLRQHLIRNHKITYSERQIRQLLKREGVPLIRPAHEPQPLRRFERDQPNEMWQVDIMSFNIGSGTLYLTSFLDDYSRFLISYSVTEEQTSEVIIKLLNRCVSFRKPLSIISDRGVQFSSWNGVTSFQLRLNALGIDHLQASEQHPQTMGKIEAFHKTIQRELLTTTEFSGKNEALLGIHDYIMFYNFARPHMGIDNCTPAERYFKHLKAFDPGSVYYRRVAQRPREKVWISKKRSDGLRQKTRLSKRRMPCKQL